MKREDVIEYLASLTSDQRLQLWVESATYQQTHEPLKVGDIVMLDTKAAEAYEQAKYNLLRRPIMERMINNRYEVTETHEGDLYAIVQIANADGQGRHWWGRCPRHCLRKTS